MTARRISCGCFCAIANRRGHVTRKRVGRIARQHRNVVALGGIESDLAGINWCKAISRRIGPAGAAAKVAYRLDVLSPKVVDAGLVSSMVWPPSQESGPGAALGDVIHAAGMEIHPKDGDGATGGHSRGAARRRNAAAGGTVRINPEGLVFFDDPSVVGKWCQSGDAGGIPVAGVVRLGVQNIDLEIAGGWEDEGNGRGRCSPFLGSFARHR